MCNLSFLRRCLLHYINMSTERIIFNKAFFRRRTILFRIPTIHLHGPKVHLALIDLTVVLCLFQCNSSDLLITVFLTNYYVPGPITYCHVFRQE